MKRNVKKQGTQKIQKLKLVVKKEDIKKLQNCITNIKKNPEISRKQKK